LWAWWTVRTTANLSDIDAIFGKISLINRSGVRLAIG
jgi:hypothetical protein